MAAQQVIIALGLALGACRVLPVKIIAPIPQSAPTPVACILEDVPKPPEPLVLDFENDNVIDRAMVHLRDYDLMITYAHDMATWGNLIGLCLRRLVAADSAVVMVRRQP